MASVRIEPTVTDRITFAGHQNDVPVLRDLEIFNDGSEALSGLELELTVEPPYCRSRRWHIDRLNPGSSVHLYDLDVELEAGRLYELTEAVRGEMIFTLRGGEQLLAERRHEVRFLACDEWGGIEGTPELLAAFVQPNDPTVERLLKRASNILRNAGKDTTLDGYRSGERRRIWEMVAAIWSAVGELKLDYALPPSSFERSGQKVRSPWQIDENGRATCLDLALMFAAVLEQAGLNPLVVITEGHAFTGAWLQPEELKAVAGDTPDSVRKRVDLSEIVVFETTLITQQPLPRFSWAVESGREHLAPEREEAFRIVIDIRRARMERLLPLPSVGVRPGGAEGERVAADETDGEGKGDLEEAPELPDFSVEAPIEPAQTPTSRLDRWQRKLLDLTKRNRLLNFRASKRAVWLVAPEPWRLEDLLAQGHRISLSPSPEVTGAQAERSDRIHWQRRHERLDEELAREALDRKEVMVRLSSDELQSRLVELYRHARSALQEGGANVLFLAVGFLAWKPDPRDRSSYKAPLILIPVTLERKSVRGGVKMMLHEDEPRFNPTLLEMLRQDFGLEIPRLDPLPRDEHGIDVEGVWNRVRQAVVDQEGFEVTTEVVLSTFSFAKYLMWKDLTDRTEALRENAVVRHLLETPREAYQSDIAFPPPERLDQELPPGETFTPLPADSSQLAAVAASARGKDMVLIGPPGTGKSQTIANLIAQNLAEGRTVLFVSEKTAALDVVYRRLERLGLGEFCLELHSNKARKLDVLNQLRRAWNARGEVDEEEWAREAERLKKTRDQLNRVVAHLHRVYPNGWTPFQAMGRVIEGRSQSVPKLAWEVGPEAHSSEQLEEFRDEVARVAVNAREVGDLANHPLRVVGQAQWSGAWQERLLEASVEGRRGAEAYASARDEVVNMLSLEVEVKSAPASEALTELARELLDTYGRSIPFVFASGYPGARDRLHQAVALVEEYQGLESKLSVAYEESLFDRADLGELAGRWKAAKEAWWLRAVFMRHGVRKSLRAYVSKRGKGAKPDAERDLGSLVRMRDVRSELSAYEDLILWTGSAYCGLRTDPQELRRTLEVADSLRRATASLASDSHHLAAIRQAVEPLLTEANDLLAEEASVGRACRKLLASAEELSQVIETFEAEARGQTAWFISSQTSDWVAEIVEGLKRLEAYAPRLRTWCAWQHTRQKVVELGLHPLVEMLEAGALEPRRAPEAFEVGYARWWAASVMDADDVLRGFVSSEHELAIEEFQAIDARFADVTRRYIRAQLSRQLPASSEIKRGSELGILNHELQKKTRHKPLRQLIKEMPTGLTRLTPCLLMSPLSIAQYLEPDQALFDLVVFDEASQITTWDAVGAIARGRQTVIVGDPKQLPPTSFFDRQDEDADEDVEIEGDLESILDESLGANLPTLDLRWHYRSRHESLIAFSNHRYYEGRLVTFPSNTTEDRSVRMVRVDGTYDKGGNRTNRNEAERLVRDIVSELTDPAFVESGRSIGVVTFNAEQQRLIEDLLDEQRRQDPGLEPYFSDDAAEPVMVKNLESVQGDERDLMYFSITYGPDRNGRVSMNFGPMNRAGGERRLNVAITRARSELRVFSSLGSDQIDLERTSALGVRDLKQFLEYAERGLRTLGQAVGGSAGELKSSFEWSVAATLTERGWKVLPQIGASAFRVDMGIVHPDFPRRFLVGVECDGETYYNAATARDRDKLRQEVLRSLGWEMIRVWSVDWWSDPEGSATRLNEKLRALLEADRQNYREDQESKVGREETSLEPVSEGVEVSSDGASAGQSEEGEGEGHGVARLEGGTREREGQTYPEHPSTQGAVLKEESGAEAGAEESTAIELPTPEPERFYEEAYEPRLLEMISAIVKLAGPVRRGTLATLIARHHGFDRTGRRIQERVDSLACKRFAFSEEGKERFFWQGTPQSVIPYRESVPFLGRRDPEDVAIEELAGLAREVAGANDREATLQQMAQRMGVRRVTNRIRERLSRALERTV